MRNELTLASVLVVLGLSSASAEINTDAAVKSLVDQGFTNIEVDRDRDDGEVKLEGWRGDQKVEVTYDAATGAVVKSETETVAGGWAADRADDRADDLRDRDDDDRDDDDRDDDGRDDDDRDDGNGGGGGDDGNGGSGDDDSDDDDSDDDSGSDDDGDDN